MRYLLDTEVLVAGLRHGAPGAMQEWLSRRPSDDCAISALSLAELQAGVSCLAHGPNRNALTQWLHEVEWRFEGAILAFDAAAARPCARLIAQAALDGRPTPLAQAMLAGIAEANGLALAARPTPHLARWGGAVVDPWSG